MKKLFVLLSLFLLVPSAPAMVRVFVQPTNGLAAINYECTAGEVVRAFALDVTVDRGQILGITNYFRGPSTAVAQGYGIFPASFRDNITVSSGSNANWSVVGYSPLAVAADAPVGTLPGLNSSGVTLELGAIWDPAILAAIPPSSGTLCTLQISQTATITVAPNLRRGGIVAAPHDIVITPQFTGALVGPAIINTKLLNGAITILFQDGELESAPALEGPWTGTGNTNGTFSEPIGTSPAKFYRVHNH
ncbi:MAG TPA: hypothetical protein VH598_14915 [Verrucomicrobiae bacterium]|nr:hypothetical protein [Verrucomicrobiae bacterium]